MLLVDNVPYKSSHDNVNSFTGIHTFARTFESMLVALSKGDGRETVAETALATCGLHIHRITHSKHHIMTTVCRTLEQV